MSPIQRGVRKGLRTLLQLVAGGALTALVAVLAHGLSPGAEAIIMAGWTALVAAAHNTLEASGAIPVLLPTPPLSSIPPPPTAAGGAAQ